MDLERGKARTLLLVEQSDVWINLHHMLKVRAVHPDECTGGGMERNIPPIPNPLPPGSFPFLCVLEQTSLSHLYLYTYCPGIKGEQAVLLRPVSMCEWIVESIIAGIAMEKDVIYACVAIASAIDYSIKTDSKAFADRRLLDVICSAYYRYGR
jgi:hypothetical protein